MDPVRNRGKCSPCGRPRSAGAGGRRRRDDAHQRASPLPALLTPDVHADARAGGVSVAAVVGGRGRAAPPPRAGCRLPWSPEGRWRVAARWACGPPFPRPAPAGGRRVVGSGQECGRPPEACEEGPAAGPCSSRSHTAGAGCRPPSSRRAVDDERVVHSCAAELMLTARGSACGLVPVIRGALRLRPLRPVGRHSRGRPHPEECSADHGGRRRREPPPRWQPGPVVGLRRHTRWYV